MDFDWAGLLSAVGSGVKSWISDERAHSWRGLANWALYLGTFIPVVITLWISRKIGRNPKTMRPIVTIPSPQAVDLWYQESRRAVDARTIATKTIATAAGIGLAAAATMLAVAGVPVGLLYVALALNSLAVIGCLWGLVLMALGHTQQARSFVRAFAGSGPEESVTIEILPLYVGKHSRHAAIALFLPALWMMAGWLTIAATTLLSSMQPLK